jgi:hypothetical protein
MKEAAPAWFNNAITEGLQVLLTLSLQNQPALDTIEYTQRTWVAAVWDARHAWVEDDVPRIAAAFLALTRTADRWPAPKHLLAAMPRPVPPRSLPEPPLTDELRRRGLAHIRDLKITRRSS